MKSIVQRMARWIGGGVIVGFTVWTLMPIALMVYVSLSYSGIAPSGGEETSFGLQNFRAVIEDPGSRFFQSLSTSMLLSTCVSTVSCLLGIPAAYALARHKTRFTKWIGAWIFSTRFQPPVVAAIPLFLLMRTAGLLGSFFGLVLVELLLALTFAVWVLRSYVEEIPDSLEQLGAVDGLSPWNTCKHILLPNLKLPVIMVAALTWLSTWNEYFFALLFGGHWRPLTVLIASWNTYQGVQWGPACAAALMAALPGALLLALSVRVLVRGFAFGWKTH